MDYLLTFDLCTEAENFNDATSKLIAVVERTDSRVGGGSDKRGGEFFINTSSRFEQSHLIEMVAILLPNVKRLTINRVSTENPRRPRAIPTHRVRAKV